MFAESGVERVKQNFIAEAEGTNDFLYIFR